MAAGGVRDNAPIVYFLGTAPGRYQAIFPAFIGAWDAGSGRVLSVPTEPVPT